MSDSKRKRLRNIGLWVLLNAAFVGYFAYAMMVPMSSVTASLLPGKTTHGHYQIELDCNACHAAESGTDTEMAANVMQDACNRCHSDQLKAANDTHPAKKFNDPTNAELLATLDAQDCLTCHREHVPEQTQTMGLTLPGDYCWHCHQDVAESRTSHEGMAFDSCATAGCHNYHDNRAIYEKYLDDHFGEPDYFDTAVLPQRTLGQDWLDDHSGVVSLSNKQADAPEQYFNQEIVDDWSQTAHARMGVNCNACHLVDDKWVSKAPMETCEACHQQQVETFVTGKHGMRLASGLSPMQPSLARLPMHAGAAHEQLTCNACHSGHRFDTQFAAVEACQRCHADSHTLAYESSSHADLWRQELAGDLPAGSGVTCASCHMPRLEEDGRIWVNHDQNTVLRPNETMARQVCGNCHGLEFSLSALADPGGMMTCYSQQPQDTTESVQMAHNYFEERRKARERRQNRSKAK